MKLIPVLLLFFLCACNDHEHHTHNAPLKLGTNIWPGYELLHLAHELDLHDEDHIKLIELTSATEVMNAFHHGKLDIAALTLDEVLSLAQTNHDLRVFLVMDISNGADKLITKNNITNLEQLKNKRIGVEQTALGAFILTQLLHFAQLDMTDITVIPSTVNKHISMMKSDQLDAVITFEPVATQLIKDGYTSLFDSSQIPGKIVDVLVTREEIIKTREHELLELVGAHWQSLAYLQKHPAKATNIMAPRLKISANELEQTYNDLILPDAEHNELLLTEELAVTADELQMIMLEKNMITKPVNIGKLITDKVLP